MKLQKTIGKKILLTFCLVLLLCGIGFAVVMTVPQTAYAQGSTPASKVAGYEYTTNTVTNHLFGGDLTSYNTNYHRNTGIMIYGTSPNGTTVSTADVKLDSTVFTIDFGNGTTYSPLGETGVNNVIDRYYHFEILNSSGSVVWYARQTFSTWTKTEGETNTTMYRRTVSMTGKSSTYTDSSTWIRTDVKLFNRATVNLAQGDYKIRIRHNYQMIKRQSFMKLTYFDSMGTINGTLTIDSVAPVINLRGYSSGKTIHSGDYANERVIVSSGDRHPYRLYYKAPGASAYTVTSSTSYTTPSTQGWYYAYSEDSCGNKSETVSFYYDGIAPTGRISSNGTTISSGSYISSNFSYAATDTGSGVTEYFYRTPNSGAYQQYMPGMVINKSSGDGWYYFYCKDKCGNVSQTVSVYLETAAPIVGIYRNGELGFSKTVTSAGTYETDLYFNVGDTFRITCDTSSGKVTSNYALNSNITITSSFPKDFEIRLTNATGMNSVFKIHVVKEKPKLVIGGTSYDDGATLYFNADKTFSWTYDTGWNGANMKIVSNGNKNIDDTVYFASGKKDYAISTDNGTETVYEIAITDAAFNVSEYTLVIDKKAPSGVIKSDGKTIESGGYTNKPACVEFTEDGVTAQYSINGGEYQPYVSGQPFSADATYIVLLTDRANNKTSYTVTVDTVAPSGQLYADYSPVEDGAITNGKIYFSWDGDITATVNGAPYTKNTVLSDDADYTFVLTDFAGNTTTYRITVDTVCPSYNADRLAGDTSYKISKWYLVTLDGENYSFATYDEALTFAASKEFASGVTVLNLENVEDFKQSHLVASNGDPENSDDEVRTGEYWLYKSKANPNSLLYYFDRDLLNEVISFYAKDTVSNVNYYVLDGDNLYGTPSESMSDNVLTAVDGTLAPVGNNFVFEQADSAEIYAELVGGDGTRVKVTFGTPFGQQFSVNGLYKLTEIDAAKNETVYYLFLDLLAPELHVNATIFGSGEATELTISKDSLAGIAAYYYESFNVKSISDADKWSVLTVTNDGKTVYYTFGDELPVLNVGGEYLLSLYDRFGNAYSFTVYIVGNPAEIAFENNGDDTAFDVAITLEQDFDTVVTLEIKRNGVALDGITTDKLVYNFDKGDVYTVTLRDNFGRVIEKEYTFVKSLPVGTLAGAENGGKTKADVTFTYDAEKYYAVVYKNGEEVLTDRSGGVLILANDENSGKYIVRLINLTDEENYNEYGFTVNTLAPETTLSGVKNNGTTNGDVSVSWTADDVVSAAYTLNGGEAQTLTSGQKMTAEGSYIVTVTNDLGTITTLTFTIDKSLDYTLAVGEETTESVDTTNQTVAIFNNEPLRISVTKNGEPLNYAFGSVLSDEGIYAVRITDDFGNAVNFTVTIDKSVSYSANAASGLISNGGVRFTNGEKLTVTATKDGKVIDYTFGQTLDDEGEYTVTLRDVYGNEKTVAFRIAKGIKQSIDYTLGDGATVISVTKNGEPYAVSGKRLNFTEDGEYVVTAEAEGVTCAFTLTLDTTAPTIVLDGVENGGVADGIVTIDEPNEEVTVEVYRNGELIDYELGQEISEYADYRVVVTDSAGNVAEYSFTLQHLLNGGAVALIIIGIFALIAVIIFIILAKRGVFKKKTPKKQNPEPDESDEPIEQDEEEN